MRAFENENDNVLLICCCRAVASDDDDITLSEEEKLINHFARLQYLCVFAILFAIAEIEIEIFSCL